jgi:ligand-binding sensor domain-containing protein
VTIKHCLGELNLPARTALVPALAAGLLLVCVLGTPVAAQSPVGAVTPFVNASDLRDLAVDESRMIWIASNGGALRFDPAEETWTVFPKLLGTGPRGNDLVTVAVDALGRVWVGSATRGFTFYDPATGLWDRLSEEWPDPRIRVIRALGSGVYIGTQDGLSLKPTPLRTDICAEAIPSCIVPSYVVNDYALMGDTLWVATQDGLGRFNGETWDAAEALPAGSVGPAGPEYVSLAVFEGTLWAATELGVRRLVNGAWEGAGINADRLVVSGGELFAIAGKTLASWSGTEWVSLVIPNTEFNAIRDLEREENGFFLATDQGLVRTRVGEANQLFVPPGPALTEPYAGIAVDSQGIVWAGTQQGRIGLVRYDGVSWDLFDEGDGLESRWIFALLSDPEDRIWVGHCCCSTPPDCRLEARVDDGFLNLGQVRNAWGLDYDSHGRIWAGTDQLGVSVLENQGGEVWDIALELTQASTGGALASNIIRTLVTTDDGTYFGHYSQGLDYWPHRGILSNGSNGSNWSHTGAQGFGLLDNNVGAIAEVGDDVWVGTAGGLHRFRDGALQSRCPTKILDRSGDQSRPVSAIVGDRRGGLWIGTDNGLLYLKRGAQCTGTGGEFALLDENNSALPSGAILSAAVSPVDGSIWVGTSAGIARIDPDRFVGANPPPDRYLLYPNPLRPDESTGLVNLGVEVDGTRVIAAPLADFSRPEVFDLTGRLVGEFDVFEGESWVWDGRNLNRDTVAPGLYLVRARRTSGEVLVLKLGVLR